MIVLPTKPGHLHSRTTKTGEDEEVANGMGVCAKISTVLNTSHELTMVMLTTILRVVNTTIPILRMKVVTLGAWWDSLPKVKESVIGRTRNWTWAGRLRRPNTLPPLHYHRTKAIWERFYFYISLKWIKLLLSTRHCAVCGVSFITILLCRNLSLSI